MLAECEKAAASYPVEMQDSVREAFQAADKGELEKASELCCKLLDIKADPEVRMLLGICYFCQGHMQDARQVYYDLAADYPGKEECHIYLGIAEHALGRYEEAVKELGRTYPPNQYHPFYYTSYGDSLQQVGRLKQSREAFRKEVDYYEQTETIYSSKMLDGAFQNLLYLDISLGNGKYPEEMLHWKFSNPHLHPGNPMHIMRTGRLVQ